MKGLLSTTLILFILLSSLLHISTCTVYTVTPDDHYYPNTTCNHCHNLQHYLLNITKYFTFNTQLLFLPGLHHLHSHLIIQNVHNISLIGSTTNGTTLDTVIQCNSSVGIVMNKITNLILRNVIIRDCEKIDKYTGDKIAVTIENCFNVFLSSLNIHMEHDINIHSMLGINILGKSKFHNVSCTSISLSYHATQTTHTSNTLLMDHFDAVFGIDLTIYKHLYELTIQLAHMTLQNHYENFLHGELRNVTLYITDSQFLSNHYTLFDVKAIDVNDDSSIKFINCKFLNNSNLQPLIDMRVVNVVIFNCIFDGNSMTLEFRGHYSHITTMIVLIKNTKFLNSHKVLIDTEHADIIIINCIFDANSKILKFSGNPNYKYTEILIEHTIFKNNYLTSANMDALITTWHANVTMTNCSFNRNWNTLLQSRGDAYYNFFKIIIKNTQFVDSVLKDHSNLLALFYLNLKLEGILVFHAIRNHNSIIDVNYGSTISIHGKVTFSRNFGHQLISFYSNINSYIKIKEPSIIMIYYNQLCNFFVKSFCDKIYQFCAFQYYTSTTFKNGNFLIEFYNNKYKCNNSSLIYSCPVPIANCHWLTDSAFYHMIPLDINKQLIRYINNSDMITVNNNDNKLCACDNEMYNDCSIIDFGYLYPGECKNIFLYHKDNGSNNHATEIIARNDISILDVPKFVEQSQVITNNYCSKVTYTTLTFWFGNWCELFLKVKFSPGDYHKRLYFRKLSCPPGFLEINKICQCDPVIVNYGIALCNISNQTVLRPSNTWIIATTYIPYSYHISKQCRFYYCLPHSSHLNFSTPNSQCQFNRSGLLCGHCQQGLSIVFSSSQCHLCSNVYLLLIIPIAIAGIGLVIILFILNITVTDGTINGFILFVNIISINTSLVFPHLEDFAPTYTFISFANLDLGIQTCFYNGMDDYAKMWLQLAFPFYLIFIATLIIITSRYSTMIQRLTARRALPVLATLFLLSYTKILRVVSNVLFFYSTITHLPSKHTTLAIVWSVDANVPLFGVRFTILFIVCLILFLILVPFNVILLFTRKLSRFKCVNRFKPILDAYQGPYKDRYYYWTGLQLLVRAMLLAISSLDRNDNLTISAIIFGILGGIHGVLRPLQSKIQNYQELLFMFYLQGLYITSLNSQDATDMTAINTIIILTMVHFCLMITYHIITYVCGVRDLNNKIMTSADTFAKWITRSFSKPQNQQFELHNSIWNNIPDVAFNYREFRESIIGQD